MARIQRWAIVALLVVVAVAWSSAHSTLLYLYAEAYGSPSPAARSTGHDALWLGHAWVDGRRTEADVDALANRMRGTGIRDLFVHTGPFSDDGTLDPALRPRARWLTEALHTALPGARVQAWLGAHPTDDELHLWEPAVRPVCSTQWPPCSMTDSTASTTTSSRSSTATRICSRSCGRRGR